ncbi:MAG: hypothetical protein MUC63_07590 [Planctomycetes bacterium]|jgi:hypothetical protein|nr:hypothetical protein [Planctomycetota bacterium]
MADPWKPATREEVEAILSEELADCTPEQREAFLRLRVPPREAPVERHGRIETVFVVAQKDDEVLYWEDVEGGFEISPVDGNGRILRRGCDQNSLTIALRRWLERA